MSNKIIHDDALLVHLTVTQMKEVLESVFQQSSSSSSSLPEIIGIEEVSRLTGYKKSTIYKLIHERKIPCIKPPHGANKVFFRTAEIYKWLQSERIETREELFQNHRKGKSRADNKTQSQQRLQTFKSLHQLFSIFLKIIKDYKAKIQELEKKIAKYENKNQINEKFNY